MSNRPRSPDPADYDLNEQYEQDLREYYSSWDEAEEETPSARAQFVDLTSDEEMEEPEPPQAKVVANAY